MNSKANNTIQATLAFVFNEDLSKVLLMKKEKPVSHAGLLNGLGGKLEEDESHLECVTREVEEEAGIAIPSLHWHEVGFMEWSYWQVSIWTSIYKGKGVLPTTFPENGIAWYDAKTLPKNVIENLRWLIPLCVDVANKARLKEKSLPKVSIMYN